MALTTALDSSCSDVTAGSMERKASSRVVLISEWVSSHNPLPERSCLRVAVLCLVIAAVWAVLAVPTILFYLPQESHLQDALHTLNSSTSCEETEVYQGSVCRESLQAQMASFPGVQDCGQIVIPSTGGMQRDLEEKARQLILAGLQVLSPSPHCVEEFVPMFCLYLFKLCNENGTVYQVSSGQCEAVRDGACESEWESAKVFNVLPDCDHLPTNCTVACQGVDGVKGAECNGSAVNSSYTNITLHCSEDFYQDGNVCRPICGQWVEWPHSTVMTRDVFLVLATSLGILASAIILVLVCRDFKRLLMFPTSLIVYESVGVFLFAISLLVGYVGRQQLFCSSKGLKDNFGNPSGFCTFSGVAFLYLMFLLLIMWFFHCLVMFWEVRFPFHASSYKKTNVRKYIHVIAFIAGVVIIPMVPNAIVFVTGGFTQVSSPPVVCLPSSKDTIFYVVILPVSLVMAAGISLVILVFDELVKRLQARSKARITQAKILIIICYYVILEATTLTAFSVAIRDHPHYVRELSAYFLCESTGVRTGEPCSPSELRRFNNHIPSMLSFVVLSLIPVVSLVYIVRVQDVKSACQKLFRKTT